MSRCPSCEASVLGGWEACPLCREPLVGRPDYGHEVYPTSPLLFNRKQLRRVLFWLSLLLVAASFGVQLLFPNLLAPVRTVWLSVATVWLVAIAVVQRRRNVGGLVAWLVVALSLTALIWNQFYGPALWATTWAIPAVCTAANLTLAVVVWILGVDASNHLAKAVLVGGIGLVPGLFVLFGWVVTPVPALVCAGLSLLLLVLMFALRPRLTGEALVRRLHV